MKSNKLTVGGLHWVLVGVIALIAVLGVYNLHSAAASKQPHLYLTQLLWLSVGVGVVICTLVPDYRITENLAYVLYAVVCMLLLAVLLQGKVAGGAQRWLRMGPFTFQPSELAKITTILCLARYFAHRVREGGYSLGMLLRLFNPSRPLAVIAVLIVNWNKPWFADPIGTMARKLSVRLAGEAVVLSDSLWFRALLVTVLVLGCIGSILMVINWERQQALLNPWPPKRRNRLVGVLVSVAMALLVLMVVWWDAQFLRDPIGYLINYLGSEGGPGGVFEHVRSSMVLRVFASVIAGFYLTASLINTRRYKGPFIDIIIAPVDLLALPALLVLVEPDLGTAGIIILIGMTMILVVGVRPGSLVIMGLLGTVVAGIAWLGVLQDYQKRRILTFIDPEHDIHGAGWNAIQSIIAVGSGRWLGKGHHRGTQTQLSFLPEQHTDFAFSVWAEETGFVGCGILLALYLLLLVLALAIAADAREIYGTLVAVGVAGLILWQTVINVGMVIGVAPVVGLTLPLFSYGGSSVLTTMLGLGLLLNVHWRRKAH